eukprot:gene3954-4207_t
MSHIINNKQGDDGELTVESQYLSELQEQKAELVAKVQTLKTDLHEWRTKLETQVKSYKSEIGDLRQALTHEVDELRSEFSNLKAAIKQQIDVMNSMQTATATAGQDNAGSNDGIVKSVL